MQQTIGQIVMTELSDPRIESARTSITRVRVQEDLLRAKVYVSILGTDAQQRLGLEGLRHAAGRIHALLRDRISLRFIPELDFLNDEQFKGTLKTWDIIRQAMNEIREKEAGGPQSTEPPEGQDDEE